MPLPLMIGIGAAAAGVLGTGAGIHGALKLKDAKETRKFTQQIREDNAARTEENHAAALCVMDELGKKELEILQEFKAFTELSGQIRNCPEFRVYEWNGIVIPPFCAEEIETVSKGAKVLLEKLREKEAGTAGGFAAAGAAAAAVTALGSAAAGMSAASFGGAAAANTAVAVLGGGALAAGSGGMALGTATLGAATLGTGLLVGGAVLGIVGTSLSNKADEEYFQAVKAEEETGRLCGYLIELAALAEEYKKSLVQVQTVYKKQLGALDAVVNVMKKNDWNSFTAEEKTVAENTELTVRLLYSMCRLRLVLKSAEDGEPSEENRQETLRMIEAASRLLAERGLAVCGQLLWSAELTEAGVSRHEVLKELRRTLDLGFEEAAALVQNTPGIIKSGLARAEAEAVKKRLETYGAKVTIR